MEFLISLAVIAVLVALYVITTYNKLVKGRVNVNEAWSDVGVQMKRRYDLVPNLVETVKGYAGHEKSTLESVIQARNSALANDGSPGQQAKSENMLTGALKSLFALSEAYPELRANESFLKLQGELSSIEEQIQRARRFYNGNVSVLNTMVQQFPSNMVAGQFGISNAEFYEIDEAETATPQVKF